MKKSGVVSVVAGGMVLAACMSTYAIPVPWEIADGGNGNYYEYVSAFVSWPTAKVASETAVFNGVNGHLVTITSREEADFVMDHVYNYAGLWAWIGLTDSEAYGGYESYGQPNPAVDGWVWVTGEPVSYTEWYGGTPNNVNNEDACRIDTQYEGHSRPNWNDAGISWGANYIIEYEGSKSVPDPSSTVSLLSLACVGLFWVSKRLK